jgi:hypothetical protein
LTRVELPPHCFSLLLPGTERKKEEAILKDPKKPSSRAIVCFPFRSACRCVCLPSGLLDFLFSRFRSIGLPARTRPTFSRMTFRNRDETFSPTRYSFLPYLSSLLLSLCFHLLCFARRFASERSIRPLGIPQDWNPWLSLGSDTARPARFYRLPGLGQLGYSGFHQQSLVLLSVWIRPPNDYSRTFGIPD